MHFFTLEVKIFKAWNLLIPVISWESLGNIMASLGEGYLVYLSFSE